MVDIYTVQIDGIGGLQTTTWPVYATPTAREVVGIDGPHVVLVGHARVNFGNAPRRPAPPFLPLLGPTRNPSRGKPRS